MIDTKQYIGFQRRTRANGNALVIRYIIDGKLTVNIQSPLH